MVKTRSLFFNLALLIFSISICLAEPEKVVKEDTPLANATFVGRHNQQHHLVKPQKGVGMIDTLRWYVGEPLEDFYGFVTTLDTIIVWFYPLATCSLLEIRANFADRAGVGWLKVSIAQRNEDDTCCLTFNENLLFEPIAWTGIEGGNHWYKMDFTHMWPPEYFQLELPGDTAFYVIMQTAKDGYPHINWDDCEGFTRTEFPHFRFTHEHTPRESPNCEGVMCQGWYFLGYPIDPWVFPELLVEAVVKYPKAPVRVQMTHLPDTYSTKGPFQVTASIWDPGGIVESVWLNFSVRGKHTIRVKEMQLQEDSTYVGQIKGEYAAGDTIDYWITCSKHGASDPTFFIIRECNPEAEILLVNDNGENRGKYYQAILDSIGYSYNYWDVNEYGGLNRDILNYGNWRTVILFGYGCGTTPGKTYTGDMWADFLAQGGNIFYSDQDYFCVHGDSFDYPGGCQFEGNLAEGEFLYDYFGVSWAKGNPEYQDTLFRGLDTVVVGEENVGETFSLHTSHLGIEAWPDYTQAREGAFNLFEAIAGETTCGTRHEGTVLGETFKTVFIPFPFEALCDYDDYEDRIVVTPEAYTIMQNIISWFETSVGTEERNYGEKSLPTLFALSQNYPNPFNSSTLIRYALPAVSDAVPSKDQPLTICLEIYNILGEKVTTLVNGKQTPGYKTVTWDAKNFASGIYFCRLRAGDFTAVKKIVLMK